MFIDLHAHTGGISRCCQTDYKGAIMAGKEAGFDALVITNHYQNPYFTKETHRDFIERYIREWELCRAYGREAGLRIFCGLEVTWAKDPRVHFLIYGADEAFLRENLFLCDRSQAELYGLCKSRGYAFVQAHPYRGGATVQDTAYLDGIEINCHPLYHYCYAQEMLDIAKKENLAVTVGCDYHHDTYRPRGGMFLPDDSMTDMDIARYILGKHKTRIQLHYPEDQMIEQMTI